MVKTTFLGARTTLDEVPKANSFKLHNGASALHWPLPTQTELRKDDRWALLYGDILKKKREKKTEDEETTAED